MTAPGKAGPAYSRELFETRNEGGVSWLRDWRARAYDAFETLPLPTTQLEEWRYTDPSRLKWDKVGLAPSASVDTVPTARARMAAQPPRLVACSKSARMSRAWSWTSRCAHRVSCSQTSPSQ